jgi:hypothetical protein
MKQVQPVVLQVQAFVAGALFVPLFELHAVLGLEDGIFRQVFHTGFIIVFIVAAISGSVPVRWYLMLWH